MAVLSGWVTNSRAHIKPSPPVSKAEAVQQLLTPPPPSMVKTAIEKLQQVVSSDSHRLSDLERLGRLYIAQSRLTYDDAGYQLADLCARLMELEQPGQPQTLLLRGHALLAMHQFHDAEEIGRQLILMRQEMVDYALLGDALMEQGMLEACLPIYQAMIDAKPCLPSYSRVANVRWLKGDLDGAIEMMEEAIACGSYREPEPMAWCTTRLAALVWQKGDGELALKIVKRAQEMVPDYAQALHLEGRILLGRGDAAAAVDLLRKATVKCPLPEILWALGDAEIACNHPAEAAAVFVQLMHTGESADPRSFAIYKATHGIDAEQTLDLAKSEMMVRRDVYSWDALAWSQLAAGEMDAAQFSISHALAAGTRDARLLLHAGIIAQRAGDPRAGRLLKDADELRPMLLPSEQRLLRDSLARAAAEPPGSSQPQVVNK